MKLMSLNLISLILSLFCLVAGEAFFTLPASAASSATSIDKVKICEEVLVGHAFTADELFPSFKPLSKISVIVSGRQIGESQLPEYILHRKGREWLSLFTPSYASAAPQGDPRTVAIILGGGLAKFFGVRSLDDRTMIVPDMEFFNSKIAELSVALVKLGYEPIPIRFYTTAEALVSDETYIREFANGGGIPVSADLDLYVHDISFHLGTLAFPGEFLRNSIEVTQVHYEFIQFLKANVGQGTKNQKMIYKWALEALQENEPQLIDFLLGNAVGLYAQYAQDPMNRMNPYDTAEVLDEQFNQFFYLDGRPSLLNSVQGRFHHMNYKVMFTSENPEDHITEEEIYKILNNLLKKFVAQNPQYNWKAPTPKYEGKKFFEDTKNRVAELNAALDLIRGQNAN